MAHKLYVYNAIHCYWIWTSNINVGLFGSIIRLVVHLFIAKNNEGISLG